MAFFASLLADVERHVAINALNLDADGVGCRMAALWPTDSELTEFLGNLVSLI